MNHIYAPLARTTYQPEQKHFSLLQNSISYLSSHAARLTLALASGFLSNWPKSLYTSAALLRWEAEH